MRIMKQFPVVLVLCVIALTALAQEPQFTIKVEPISSMFCARSRIAKAG